MPASNCPDSGILFRKDRRPGTVNICSYDENGNAVLCPEPVEKYDRDKAGWGCDVLSVRKKKFYQFYYIP